MRRVLARAASDGRTVTYGTLMRLFGLSRGRALSAAIGDAERSERALGAPGFAAIVVRKDTGFPGGGYFRDNELPKQLIRPPGTGADPRLTPAERSYAEEQQRLIWGYYGRSKRRGRRPTT